MLIKVECVSFLVILETEGISVLLLCKYNFSTWLMHCFSLSQNSHSKSLMNWGNIKTHATFLRKGFLTKSTYKRFLWIMNRTNMCIQITFLEKRLSQNSHSKGLFPSCTEVTWRFIVLFWKHYFWQNLHTKEFFASWI